MDTSRISAAPTTAVERSAIRKISIRLVPFVALMFFINHLDHTAIGFLKDVTGDYQVSMFVVGGFMLISAILMVLLSRATKVTPDPGAEIPVGH